MSNKINPDDPIKCLALDILEGMLIKGDVTIGTGFGVEMVNLTFTPIQPENNPYHGRTVFFFYAGFHTPEHAQKIMDVLKEIPIEGEGSKVYFRDLI